MTGLENPDSCFRYGDDVANLTLSQRNAETLLRCAMPKDLTALLLKVWTPIDESLSLFTVDSGKGRIHSLDFSKLVFFSKIICKKLISFIGFHGTDADARNAAMDVFTWLCIQQPVLDNSYVLFQLAPL